MSYVYSPRTQYKQLLHHKPAIMLNGVTTKINMASMYYSNFETSVILFPLTNTI